LSNIVHVSCIWNLIVFNCSAIVEHVEFSAGISSECVKTLLLVLDYKQL
jgi:hypothetical protein